MKIAMYQPYFFPYIGYFQLMNAVDKFILYTDVDYIRQGWINRNRILQRGKGDLYITVPVHHNTQMLIKDVIIDNVSKRWVSKITQSITQNYSRSPYFGEVFPFLEELINGQVYQEIAKLDEITLRAIANYLDIRTEIVNVTGRYSELEKKLACMQTVGYKEFLQYEEKKVPKMSIRIMEICHMEIADSYISAIGGITLYDKQSFDSYGVSLNFIQTHDIRYEQYSENFIPNLSIIDVLMHNGKEKTKELLTQYTLI